MASELANAIVAAAERMKRNDEEDNAVAGNLHTSYGGGFIVEQYNFTGGSRYGYITVKGDYFAAIHQAKLRGLVPIEGSAVDKSIQLANEAHRKAKILKEIIALFKAVKD